MKAVRIAALLTLALRLAALPAAAQEPGTLSIECGGPTVRLAWPCVTGRAYMLYGTGRLGSPWLEVETAPRPLVAASNRLSCALAMPTNSHYSQKLWELTPTPNGTNCFWKCTNLTDYAAIPAGWK